MFGTNQDHSICANAAGYANCEKQQEVGKRGVRKLLGIALICALLIGGALLPARAQLSPQETWVAQGPSRYVILPGITYLTIDNFNATLDIYKRVDGDSARPTAIFIHGGGWAGGTKEAGMMLIMPWLEMGWNVVNVDYRVARNGRAPAAVEDCLCALHWIVKNAAKYNIDPNRLIVTGDSSGGHLSLMTGMTPDSAGLDRQCSAGPLPKVAAIIDWYGITDVNELLDGPNERWWAVDWLGSTLDRDAIAKRVSPLTYVRAGLPPILIIHGNADPTVPYTQSVRLHEALDKAGTYNEFLTIPNGKHGGFTPSDYLTIWDTIHKFVTKELGADAADGQRPKNAELPAGGGAK